MGREKKNAPRATSGGHAKERHKRDRDRKGNLIDWTAPLPPGLVARPDRPKISSKHKSWFEFIENKDKKKKLEFEFTENRDPPPGFEFVPIGNPALTTACKELSREQGAMIFIVTSSHGYYSKGLSLHLNRAGHHIRQSIVEQARKSLGDDQLAAVAAVPGQPEPIPERQEDINRQADAAIRDLFPRIPNTDRQMIIEHAFNKTRLSKGEIPVGLASQLTLSRRVQLAVLAHIRHNHTRYDQLLKETTYVNARKAVESLCLDILVKWRGDEETGRDQLDEILCEVIVISDSESDDSGSDDDDEESSDTSSSAEEIPERGMVSDGLAGRATLPPAEPSAPLSIPTFRGEGPSRATLAPQGVKKASHRDRKAAKWAQRGFGRYQAARDQAWHQAVERQRLGNDQSVQSGRFTPVDGSTTNRPQQWHSGEPGALNSGLATVRSGIEPPPCVQRGPYRASLPPVESRYVSGSARSYADDLQSTVPPAAYRMPQGTRIQRDSPSRGFEPVVRPRPPLDNVSELERVSHHGQDLKDLLVPSIEPRSPDLSHFPPRSPFPNHQPGPGFARVAEGPVRASASVLTGEATTSRGVQNIYHDEGFVKLPPRSDASRMPAAPDPGLEPFILVRSQPMHTTTAVDTPTSVYGGLGARHSSAYYDNGPGGNDGSIPKSGSRPIWVGDDGFILRSEARPILIQDDPPPFRTSQAEPAYRSSRAVPRSPTEWIPEGRPGSPRWVEDNRRHVDPIVDRRIETLRNDFVEIVRVSNKFPKRYEPDAAQTNATRGELRSATFYPSVSHQVNDDAVLRYSQQFPTQSQQSEHHMGRVEQSAVRHEIIPFAPRHPAAYGSAVHERVVGIEYVHPRPSFRTHTYWERDRRYEAGDPMYRSRSASIIPAAYSNSTFPPQADRRVPRADEVITLD